MPYPELMRLKEKGDLTRQGEPLAFLQIAVRENRLILQGRTPLEDNGETYTAMGMEYRYVLEAEQAEQFLSTLQKDFGDNPECAIFMHFEFFNPTRRLADYLDAIGVVYEYNCIEGEHI